MRLPLPLTILYSLLSCGLAAGPPEPVKSPAHTNRLASEKSPYLLQHRHNPVDWYPWGPEAFARARAENKPILLSIGYSTCHWCHVMERESFENEAIGKFLNEHFISIKLDREERPDIDQVYMTAMQTIGLGGGWPLNVFLTPDRKPFYGGTYFPPADKEGRPGFPAILKRVADVWKENRDGLLADAEKLTTELKATIAGEETGKVPGGSVNPDLIVTAAIGFSNNFDEKNGGFSGAPKFPQPKIPSLVLLTGVHTENKIMVDEVLFTCRRMAAGGLYDQIGGGFARYSVDDYWLVPHFEKMLYDNAQLIDLYLDAGLVSGDPRYHAVVRDIIQYLLRDMTHPDGGFYSAEDADSEGQEGKFYCFTRKELLENLTPDEAAFAIQWFGVTEEGNFQDHSHPQPLPNLNVLHVADPERKLSEAEKAQLASIRSKLYDLRKTRVRPHLDDKVLSSWNGLLLGPLARAAVILNEPAWMEAAKQNFKFVTTQMWEASTRTLHHRWREGQRDSVQLLNAYAFYLNGSIMLYQATLDPAILTFCMQLADSMITRFYDEKAGGFYTSEAGDDLLFRARDSQDGAEPAGNSMAVQSLLQLAAITGNASYRAKADATLSFYGVRLTDLPEALPMMLHSVAFASTEPFRAVITGDPGLPATQDLIRAAHSVYQAHRVVLGATGPVEEFARTLTPKDGKPTAYICSGTSCQPPTHDPARVRTSLRPPGLVAPEPAD